MTLTVASATAILENETGIVIPTYFGADVEPEFAYDLLFDTVKMFVREVALPTQVCLSVDGPGPALPIAQRVARTLGVRLVDSECNGGKLACVRNGMAVLLDDTHMRYLAVADHDGDHFANELLNFVRCAEYVCETANTLDVLVLGNRLSRHRSLGFLRGEQEELANRILFDALHYAAVKRDQPLTLQFANTVDDLPDFHSGYKLFSRATAQTVFLGEPNLAGCDEAAYYRHACEAVMCVEALEQGAILATVNRRTFDEQPISVFARLDRAQLAANMILWPCKRLGIPGHFVEQWLTNHLQRLLACTLVPQGRDELVAIRRLVLAAYNRTLQPASEDEVIRPQFI